MNKLLDKAKTFTQYREMVQTDWLYRNGHPILYFTKVINEENGVMKKVLKDINGGHGRCPLNGRVSGLFFYANVNLCGDPPIDSYFGSRRLMIPCHELLENTELYFGQFYCMKPGGRHYVTVVATKYGSDAHTFCKQNLPKLDPLDNPFLKKQWTNVGCRWFVNCGFNPYVEVLYTENIDIKWWLDRGAKFCDTIARGTGRPKIGGKPRSPFCTVCAVSPQQPQLFGFYGIFSLH